MIVTGKNYQGIWKYEEKQNVCIISKHFPTRCLLITKGTKLTDSTLPTWPESSSAAVKLTLSCASSSDELRRTQYFCQKPLTGIQSWGNIQQNHFESQPTTSQASILEMCQGHGRKRTKKWSQSRRDNGDVTAKMRRWCAGSAGPWDWRKIMGQLTKFE